MPLVSTPCTSSTTNLILAALSTAASRSFCIARATSWFASRSRLLARSISIFRAGTLGGGPGSVEPQLGPPRFDRLQHLGRHLHLHRLLLPLEGDGGIEHDARGDELVLGPESRVERRGAAPVDDLGAPGGVVAGGEGPPYAR